MIAPVEGPFRTQEQKNTGIESFSPIQKASKKVPGKQNATATGLFISLVFLR